MPTPQSSTSPYATPDDMIARYDVRPLCQLCSDAGAPLTPTQLQSSPRLLTLLMDASGEVEAAAFVAGAYASQDLQAMAGTASGSLLSRLVCDLAMGMLFGARPDREGKPPEYVVEAGKKLEALRKGRRVFGLMEQQAAGQLGIYVETASDVENRAGVVFQARRFFGRRTDRLQGP